MKSKGVIPDTCAWIDYFKSSSSSGLGQIIERILFEEQVYICGPVIFELVQGIRSQNEKDNILHAIEGLKQVDISNDLWLKAGELSAKLRKSGITIPFSDLIIGVAAIENNLSVLTLDKHFDQIPDLKLYCLSTLVQCKF